MCIMQTYLCCSRSLQLAQFFYTAASQNGSTSAMDAVLSPALRRQMELPGGVLMMVYMYFVLQN